MESGNAGVTAHFGTLSKVAKGFNLDLDNLKVEIFRPGTLGIFVEKVGQYQFRIHINLEENRIVSVKQLCGPRANLQLTDPFAKYKDFMK